MIKFDNNNLALKNERADVDRNSFVNERPEI